MPISMNELWHAYASKYYDPVKAKEYYERTKKLKGRRSTAGMTEEQRKIWSVASSNIRTERKEKAAANRESTKKQVVQLRDKAATVRKSISEKLKNWLASITQTAQYERQMLAIPKTASAEQKAHLREVNAQRREQITEEAASGRSSSREQAAAEREKVAKELKAAVDTIRTKAAKVREQLEATMEKTLDAELENIKASETKFSRK